MSSILSPSGELVEGEDMVLIFIDHFSSFFTSTNPTDMAHILGLIGNRVTDEMRADLDCILLIRRSRKR